jgi:hypothetical protein
LWSAGFFGSANQRTASSFGATFHSAAVHFYAVRWQGGVQEGSSMRFVRAAPALLRRAAPALLRSAPTPRAAVQLTALQAAVARRVASLPAGAAAALASRGSAGAQRRWWAAAAGSTGTVPIDAGSGMRSISMKRNWAEVRPLVPRVGGAAGILARA